MPTTPLTKMRTSQSLSRLAALSSSIPNINLIGGSSPQANNDPLPSTRKDLDKDVSDKEKRSPSLPPSTASGEGEPKSSSSTETSPNRTLRVNTRKDSYSDEEMIQPRQRIGHYYVNVTAKPRAGKTGGKSSSAVKPKEMPHIQPLRHCSPEQDTRRRGSLPPEVSQKVPPPRFPTRVRKGSVDSNEETNPFSLLMQKGHVQSIQANLIAKSQGSNTDTTNTKPFTLGMKRSFRYRHITLKKEQPLPLNVLEEGSSDDDETEDEEHKPNNLKQMYRMKEFANSTPNLTLLEQGQVQSRINRLQKTRNVTTTSFGVTPQTNYSKITVVGVKVHSCSNSPTHRPNVAIETNSILTSKKKTVPISLRTSNSEGTIISSSVAEKEDYYPLPPPLSDDIDLLLPDRYHNIYKYDIYLAGDQS